MVRKMTTENLIETIQLTRRYESYRILKLWGIALITIPFVNLLTMLLFDAWLAFSKYSEYIYPGLQGLVIIVIIVFFTRGFLSTRKLEIRDKKIVSRYYVKLGLALLGILIFFAVLFMIAMLLENLVASSTPFKSFPFILGGTLVKNKDTTILIYWGDNLALLFGYLLLRNKKEGIMLIELPITVVFLTIIDILTVTLNPRFLVVILFDEYFAFILSFFAVICGIVSLVKAYKYLKKQDILDTKQTR